MKNAKRARTASGRVLSDRELEGLADEVEKSEYDVEVLKTRRRGRPPLGSGPAGVVPVRLDETLRGAVEARAAAEHTTASEVIRTAIRRYLKVP